MGFMDWMRGKKPAGKLAVPPSSQFPSQPQSHMSSAQSHMHTQPGASMVTNRREMLRVVLRDTLNRHGIPTAWVAAEILNMTSRQREPGLHWRLLIKHWDPRLLPHMIALQHGLIKRVTTFDPMAANWLMGISWQFALEDESVCPPLPHPGFWTADPPRARPAPAEPVAGGSGDVIAGPVHIGVHTPPASHDAMVKEDLEKLFALRDAHLESLAQERGEAPVYEATQPAGLGQRT